MPLESKLARTGHEDGVLICCTEMAVADNIEKVRVLRCELGCEVLAMGQRDGLIDLGAVLTDLGERGITEMVVEGGAKVLNSFLREKLADKVMVYVAPLLIGGETATAIKLDELAQRLGDVRIEKFGDDVRSEEHTSELQSHSFISYAVFCLKKKNKKDNT